MYELTIEQQHKAIKWLVFWHIVVIAASNYLVQFPFTVFGLHNTWGAFTFPFVFLTTDLTVRIFGREPARRIIFWAMLPALIVSYLVSVLFQDGGWVGAGALAQFNGFVARIALASFVAYVFGQLLDITVFNRLRQLKNWWVAPAASTLLGSALDTLVFFSVAFFMSQDPFMAQHWPQIALLDYAFKITISALFFLPAYGLLLRYLTHKLIVLKTMPPAANAANP
ncbi:7-cyano-7-deazaguanine/7-aminomethyl-7-deazaguanine transporter [Stenoxybacter acetivorans]|uniref:7-cyano-7-deazaguanine/7-aminomethyl-7- deazaguanine transporter n=1 Tax=Stenoxybacter acetivorans TaxID=422441 RepID=UPI0005627941|nr:7-cyano-7-deazaguanine/7-aminomethyl-7-deazaguanine transporter [Stenoxybacter acetivorans]